MSTAAPLDPSELAQGAHRARREAWRRAFYRMRQSSLSLVGLVLVLLLLFIAAAGHSLAPPQRRVASRDGPRVWIDGELRSRRDLDGFGCVCGGRRRR